MVKNRKHQARRPAPRRRQAARAVITTIQIRTTAASTRAYRPKVSRSKKRSRR